MLWTISHRCDDAARPLADRHYNRQNIGAVNFMPPGRCVVLLSRCRRAVFGTSWPFTEYVKHAWGGAWVNSLFRTESRDLGLASDLIRLAIAATRHIWPLVPSLGMITFVDPKKVRPVWRHGKPIYGYCYLKAGFEHVGFTQGGLWAWQLLPSAMPLPSPAYTDQRELEFA